VPRAQPDREIGVPRHPGDAYSQWDGVALEARGNPLTVPALVGMGERVNHGPLEATASGKHRRDLAVRGQRPRSGLRVRKSASDEPQTAHPGLTRGGAAHVSPSISQPELITTKAIAAL
jgi:hypothetical protein